MAERDVPRNDNGPDTDESSTVVPDVEVPSAAPAAAPAAPQRNAWLLPVAIILGALLFLGVGAHMTFGVARLMRRGVMRGGWAADARMGRMRAADGRGMRQGWRQGRVPRGWRVPGRRALQGAPGMRLPRGGLGPRGRRWRVPGGSLDATGTTQTINPTY